MANIGRRGIVEDLQRCHTGEDGRYQGVKNHVLVERYAPYASFSDLVEAQMMVLSFLWLNMRSTLLLRLKGIGIL